MKYDYIIYIRNINMSSSANNFKYVHNSKFKCIFKTRTITFNISESVYKGGGGCGSF